jgi:DNA-binding response OmpR family regulator
MKRVLAIALDDSAQATILERLGPGFDVVFVTEASQAEGGFDLVVTLPSTQLWQLTSGKIRVDLATQQAYFDERLLELTGIEFRLLCQFLRHPDQTLSREKILSAVWGEQVFVLGRTIDRHICSLRRKLHAGGRQVETIEGVGYRLVTTRAIAKAA